MSTSYNGRVTVNTPYEGRPQLNPYSWDMIPYTWDNVPFTWDGALGDQTAYTGRIKP